MSTDLRHDLGRASEDRHSQNWREYLEQERTRAKSRGWLKHRQHVIRMEQQKNLALTELSGEKLLMRAQQYATGETKTSIDKMLEDTT